jgi:tetratricopeptide (TPR) repeat protein
MGQPTEAESKFKEARKLLQNERQAGREEIIVVTNLGTLYADTGQSAHSGECFDLSLKLAKKRLSPDDVLFATIFVGLAADRFRKGDYRSAQKYLERALPIRQKALGENHPDVAEVLNNLGVAQEQAKDYDKAVSNFLRARSIFERSSRSYPSDLANVLNNLGVIYHRMKKPAAEAEAVLRDAVEIYRKNLTADQSGLATALFDLAAVLLDDARPLEAEDLLKEAVARRAALKHRVEVADADVYEEYALVLKRNGRVADAAVAEERAKSLRSQLRFMLRP